MAEIFDSFLLGFWRRVQKKIWLVLALVCAFCWLPSCVMAQTDIVYASQFPQYDIASRLCGDIFEVRRILPAGADSHFFEPTARDIAGISSARLFIYSANAADGWSGKVLDTVKGYPVKPVDAAAGIEMIEEEGHEGHDHEDHGGDAHYWLDISNAVKMTETILAALLEDDPVNAQLYSERAEELIAEFNELDNEIREFSSQYSGGKKLVFCGKFAYLYFLDGYGFDFVSAYRGCSAEAEPSLTKISEVISYIEQNGIGYIFREEYSHLGVAAAVAAETGAEALVFHTAHNLGKSDFEAGLSYLEIMRQNFENVKRALS